MIGVCLRGKRLGLKTPETRKRHPVDAVDHVGDAGIHRRMRLEGPREAGPADIGVLAIPIQSSVQPGVDQVRPRAEQRLIGGMPGTLDSS